MQKTETDYDVVLLLRKSRKKFRFDPICFHAQQCAEKYLKGRLTEAKVAFPKTHDLGELLKLVLPIEPLWSGHKNELDSLNHWSVTPRYPGSTATAAEARAAFEACHDFRGAARLSLGLRA